MIYRENTAYDFDLFTDKKNREVVELPDPPVKQARTTGASKSGTAAAPRLKQRLFAVAAVAAVLLLVFAQLHCQLQHSEVVDQISKTEKSIETLQSEQTRLQMLLEEKISFTNMEKTAKELGMQKVTVNQTQYITLCHEDSAEIVGRRSGLQAAIDDLF